MKCDSTLCPNPAVYCCHVKMYGAQAETYVRNYCEHDTKLLVEGMAKVLRDMSDERLHEYLEVEHVDAQVS